MVAPEAALADLLSADRIDALLAEADAAGTGIDGPDGPLARMTKAVIERALDAEMADHLGYEAGDPAGRGSGNCRNGHGRTTVLTTAGPVPIETGGFRPRLHPQI